MARTASDGGPLEVMRKCTLSHMEEQIRGPSIDNGELFARSHNGIPHQQAKLPQAQKAKMVCFEQPPSFPKAKLVISPKGLRASVTERRYRAPARIHGR
jgi:hypothetical protein